MKITIPLLLSLGFTLNSFAINLKFHNQIVMPDNQVFKDTPVGGISGIRYDESEKLIYAISDDRSRKAPARFYTYKVNQKSEKLNLELNDVTLLKTKKGSTYAKGSVDFEDIEIINNQLYITSEGNVRGRFIQPPRIAVFNKDGSYQKDLMVDSKFKPTRENGHFVAGIRDNLAFEPLTATKDKNYIFTSTEDALIQDGPVASIKDSSKVRLIKYTKTGSGYVPNHEYLYHLGPLEVLENAPKSLAAQSGIPALLALSDNKLISMERTYYPVTGKTTVLLFNVEIDDTTTNIESLPSLKRSELGTTKVKSVKKTLLVDLDQYLPLLTTKFKGLDNIEAMCFGPKLSNGNDTLIVASDNNFSKYQRTEFLIFEIIK